MGTNIHRVLLFTWVILFKEVTVPMGNTSIHVVLVIDGYCYTSEFMA